MGTIGQWAEIVIGGGGWGAFLAWVLIRDNMPNAIRAVGRKHRVVTTTFCVLWGIFFQLFDTFGWRRSLHTPLIYVTVTATVALLIASYKVRSVHKNSSVTH